MAPSPSRLRVAVDATSLLDTRTGVGTVVAALLERLAVRHDVDVTAFAVSLRGRERLPDVLPDGIAARTPPVPARVVRAAWMRADRPRIDRAIGRHDVVHGPNFLVPPSRSPRIATVHDLTCLRFPELCTRHTRQYPALIRRAAASGAWFHTPSDAVRHELLDHLGVAADRVVVVHNGFTPMTGGDAGRGRALAGRDRYVLAVGTVEPRKDLPSLVRAIDRLATGGIEIPLVHVGPDGWGAGALRDAVAGMARPDLFTRLGARSGQELADLFVGARIFAYPSVYEGFGIPVLEAMSAGVPVVSTTDPAVREVAGDAAVLVPVGDVDALAGALDRCWDDDELRSDLVAAGTDRVGRFSWDRFADGMVALYRRAADSGAL